MESGKFVLRVSSELHRSLKEEARDREISLNDICVERLSQKAWLQDQKQQEFVGDLKSFFKEDLLGVVLISDPHPQVIVFLNDQVKINALMQWDWEEFSEEKYQHLFKVSFLPFPESKRKSLPLLSAALFGVILFDWNQGLEKILRQLKKEIYLKISESSTEPYRNL